jgi:hypothetical protein
MILRSPVIVVLSTTEALLSRTREVIEPRGFSATDTSLTTVRQDVTRYKPSVLFIDHSLYEFDPEAFDALARETNTKLAIVNDVKQADSLLQRLINPANPSGLYAATNSDPEAALLEADTGKYDAQTVHTQLEKMREIGEADTLKLDRQTLQKQLQNFREEQSPFETIRSDRKTLRDQLERLTADEVAEAQSFAHSETSAESGEEAETSSRGLNRNTDGL